MFVRVHHLYSYFAGPRFFTRKMSGHVTQIAPDFLKELQAPAPCRVGSVLVCVFKVGTYSKTTNMAMVSFCQEPFDLIG